jgi:hypothetical protein
VRDEVAGARESLLPTRFYIILYGERATNLAELKRSLNALDEQCERVIAAIRQIPGANADREEPEALRALYPTAIAGELSPKLTGRELTEISNSVVALTPTEDSWAGADHPHTVVSTVTGRLIGIDLFDRNRIPSPLIQIIAAPRGGKSILMAQFACDILASLRDASVNAIDIGETLLPLVTVLGGRYIRPRPDEVRAINIWSYADLKDGEMPDDTQKALVVGDLKMLARVKDDDKTAEDIISASNNRWRIALPRMSHAVLVVADKTALVRLQPIFSTKCGRSKRSIHSSSECSSMPAVRDQKKTRSRYLPLMPLKILKTWPRSQRPATFSLSANN